MNPVSNMSNRKALISMAKAYMHSRMLACAARMGVADALRDKARPVEELARECSADKVSLYRLLRALSSLGLVREVSHETFVLTDQGQLLRQDVPDSVLAEVIFWADVHDERWSHLTECVRTGLTAANVMRCADIPSRWPEDISVSPEYRAVMGTGPEEDYARIAESWDFSTCRVVADLGGGGASLLIAILRRNPALNGLLVDRPDSLVIAARRIHEAGLTPRCDLIPSDLLESVPKGADVYLLKHVLHGFDDARAVQILRNCCSVIPDDGRILIIEFLIPYEVVRSTSNLQRCMNSDLNMLVITGGKERTAVEWRDLLKSAGLRLLKTVPVPGDEVVILEAGQGSE